MGVSRWKKNTVILFHTQCNIKQNFIVGFGNCYIRRKTKIRNFEDLEEIKERIRESNEKLDDDSTIVILNYQELKEDK